MKSERTMSNIVRPAETNAAPKTRARVRQFLHALGFVFFFFFQFSCFSTASQHRFCA
ncbi:hypothetical protein Hanom_Chr06g00546421 [Helianthus anomalus]